MPDICFRCDGNLQIGSGHLARCLTLAKALRDKGATCSFVCREHSRDMAERIILEGFEMAFLPEKEVFAGHPDEPTLAHAAWLGTDWQTDADQTIAALGDSKQDWLIVDHYALDYRWEEKLRSLCQRVMAIDDLADRRHDCDLLLDQNLVANMESRYDGLLPEMAARLIGPSWALLQPEYAELHPRTPPRIGPVKHILIYFGGADYYNLTGRAIGAFLALGREDVQLSVVINPSGIHADAIRAQVSLYSNITLYGALPGLAPLMLHADLAIGAVGATSWERCCLGLPTLGITLAENQRPIAEALHQKGYITWLGDWDEVSDARLTEQLLQWMDKKNVEEVSLRCKSLVDGKGGERVAASIIISLI
jgi:UDP-2,4-diacetamido-2,4,6-trideoxy-beta-L-altropyranose hydrolase